MSQLTTQEDLSQLSKRSYSPEMPLRQRKKVRSSFRKRNGYTGNIGFGNYSVGVRRRMPLYSSQKRFFNQLLRASEPKVVEATYATTSVAGTGTASTGTAAQIDFANPANGPDVNERIGNKIYCTGLKLRTILQTSATAADQGTVTRRLVLKVVGGSNVSDADILAQLFSLNGTTAMQGNIQDLSLRVNKSLFFVLKDDLITLATQAASATMSGVYSDTVFIRERQALRFLNTSSASPENFRYHIIYMIRDADNDSDATTTLNVNGACHLYYRDI